MVDAVTLFHGRFHSPCSWLSTLRATGCEFYLKSSIFQFDIFDQMKRMAQNVWTLPESPTSAAKMAKEDIYREQERYHLSKTTKQWWKLKTPEVEKRINEEHLHSLRYVWGAPVARHNEVESLNCQSREDLSCNRRCTNRSGKTGNFPSLKPIRQNTQENLIVGHTELQITTYGHRIWFQALFPSWWRIWSCRWRRTS